MGFGLLFIGYTMLVIVWGYQIDPNLALGFDLLPDLLGYLLIFRGLRNLKPYSKGFIYARLITIPLLGIGGIIFAAEGLALLGNWVPTLSKLRGILSTLINTADTISIPLLIFFHFYLCQGIRELAAEVELPKIVFRSKLAIVFSSTYYLGRLVAGFLPLLNILQWCLGILGYVVYFFDLYLLYSCYMHIVYADEKPKEIFNPLMNLLEKSKKNGSDPK